MAGLQRGIDIQTGWRYRSDMQSAPSMREALEAIVKYADEVQLNPGDIHPAQRRKAVVQWGRAHLRRQADIARAALDATTSSPLPAAQSASSSDRGDGTAAGASPFDPSCVHPDTYFDRDICAADDWMHTRCRECGIPLDGDCGVSR